MTWKRALGKRKEWYRTVDIGDGWKVRMSYWYTTYSPSDVCPDADVSLIAYRGPYLGRWTWRREGKASGPGGTRVASAALGLLREVEDEIRKSDWLSVHLYVTGATLRLYMAYRAVLKRRDYQETAEASNEYGPAMLKVLRPGP
ncbi:hypothetical protein SEA_WATERT_99 [Microbacterium phage WaterT]|nr:hypothetical protein SEA_WATERT_99 [Microbacterium phage WaterT]